MAVKGTGPIRVQNWKRKPNREEPGGMSEPPGGAAGERGNSSKNPALLTGSKLLKQSHLDEKEVTEKLP